MERRSFCLTKELLWKLQNIRELFEQDNISQALRFCVEYTFDELAVPNPKSKPGHLEQNLIQKNNILLRTILMELVKMHQGQVKPLDQATWQYLNELKLKMQQQMEEPDEHS